MTLDHKTAENKEKYAKNNQITLKSSNLKDHNVVCDECINPI